MQVSACGGQYLAVTAQEDGSREPVAGLVHLGVGEREPDFGHLAGCKEIGNQFDMGTQKGHIAETFADGFGCPVPHAGAFDIDADKVLSAVRPSQSYCIFAMSASQFQNDGIIVMENFFVPSPPESVALGMHFLVGGLEDIGIASHIGEFGQFILAHDDVVLC